MFRIAMPGRSYAGPLPPLTELEALLRDRLREHVHKLAGELGERSVRQPEALRDAADYLDSALKSLDLDVSSQEFKSAGITVRNVVAELRGTSRADEIIVVGGHYDSVTGCPGANDNATGAAAVLEIARTIAGQKTGRTVRFVEFVNEEPPFFQSEEMGSLNYARRCRERNENIVAMLSVETIGYYSDRKGSQGYPFPLNLLYPDTGNFIGFVADWASGGLAARCIDSFRKRTMFPSEGIAAPDFIPGIGWSDQWAFWHCGYRAIMITDTALYRYPHYHTAHDTPDKVDYDRTARVVAGISRVVADLSL